MTFHTIIFIVNITLYPSESKTPKSRLWISDAGFDLSLLCCHWSLCCGLLLCNDRVTTVVFRLEEQHDSSHPVNPLGFTHMWTHTQTQRERERESFRLCVKVIWGMLNIYLIWNKPLNQESWYRW